MFVLCINLLFFLIWFVFLFFIFLKVEFATVYNSSNINHYNNPYNNYYQINNNKTRSRSLSVISNASIQPYEKRLSNHLIPSKAFQYLEKLMSSGCSDF